MCSVVKVDPLNPLRLVLCSFQNAQNAANQNFAAAAGFASAAAAASGPPHAGAGPSDMIDAAAGKESDRCLSLFPSDIL